MSKIQEMGKEISSALMRKVNDQGESDLKKILLQSKCK
jgi:hypothetical protein